MILSIESSCDDSSIAITDITTCRLIKHIKISQEQKHNTYGGVVPELAARLHAKALPNILNECKEYFPSLKAIAVTTDPGLSVTLIEGIMMAKALSISLKIPLIGVNHLMGHVYSLFIGQKKQVLPLGVLLVSGGHTMVFSIDKNSSIQKIATTLDDSFGESFDKVAKMLNLGYPGGAIIEQKAAQCVASDIEFSVPMLKNAALAYSFSGLKNQVRLEIEKRKEKNKGNLTKEDVHNVAHAFQTCAVKHIMHKLKKIFQTHHFKDFAIVGGASANLNLRDGVKNLCQKHSTALHVSELQYCSDNAAMIGRYAVHLYERRCFSDLQNLTHSPKSIAF